MLVLCTKNAIIKVATLVDDDKEFKQEITGFNQCIKCKTTR